MRALVLAASLAAAHLRGELQYRANFVVNIVYGLVYQLTGFVFIWVLLGRFESLAGWTLGEVAFLYGLRLLVHALRGLTFGNVGRELEQLVRRGDFDRMLVRPLPPLLQVMARRVPINDFGNLIGGIGVFLAANALVDVDWSASALAYLALAVLGGCLVEAAIELACVSFSFRMISAHALFALANDVNNKFGSYPLTIFGGATRFALTFGIPIAFIAYVPATVLLGRTNELSVHPALAYGAPAVGAAMFGLAYLFWRSQLTHYQSAGH
jgi:ABC-2 type transport system permease protein